MVIIIMKADSANWREDEIPPAPPPIEGLLLWCRRWFPALKLLEYNDNLQLVVLVPIFSCVKLVAVVVVKLAGSLDEWRRELAIS